jgi:hypothetical protein
MKGGNTKVVSATPKMVALQITLSFPETDKKR